MNGYEKRVSEDEGKLFLDQVHVMKKPEKLKPKEKVNQ
jgi:hypothetical protein